MTYQSKQIPGVPLYARRMENETELEFKIFFRILCSRTRAPGEWKQGFKKRLLKIIIKRKNIMFSLAKRGYIYSIFYNEEYKYETALFLWGLEREKSKQKPSAGGKYMMERQPSRVVKTTVLCQIRDSRYILESKTPLRRSKTWNLENISHIVLCTVR